MENEKPKKHRTFDDVMRLSAALVCIFPVATLCILHIMSYAKMLAGGSPVSLTEANAAFHDLVLIVIGGAVGLAFGRGNIKADVPTNQHEMELTK